MEDGDGDGGYIRSRARPDDIILLSYRYPTMYLLISALTRAARVDPGTSTQD